MSCLNDEDIYFDLDIDLFEDLDYENISSKIEDDVDIEKLIAIIRKAQDEVEFLKKLKKRRSEPIDIKIEKLLSNEDKLRNLILDLMPKLFPKKNSVDFPGVGKVSQRKTKGKWVITDEEALTGVLKKFGLYDELVNIKETVDKKKLPNAVSRILATSDESSLEGVEFQKPDRDMSLVLKIYKEDEDIKEEIETDSSADLGF